MDMKNIRISKIYRESGHEEKIANVFENIDRKNNLYCYLRKINTIC